MSNVNKTIYSNYWLNGSLDGFSSLIDDKITKLSEIDDKSHNVNAYYLASIRRTINKLVNVLSDKKLNVIFTPDIETGGTDGNTIVLSSEIHDGNLDSTVGLALHEATHCIITNMEIPAILQTSDKRESIIPSNIYDKAKKINYGNSDVNQFVNSLLNWIEDRRIDYWQYMNSPGYKGYYNALYRRYFFNETTRLMLQSDKYRSEDMESYFVRTINLMGSATDLKALKGLEKINSVLDLNNIKRLHDTNDAFILTLSIIDIILDYAVKSKNKKQKKPSDFGKGRSQRKDSKGNSGNDNKSKEWDKEASVQISTDGSGNPVNWDELSDKQKEQVIDQMKKMISDQKDFLNIGNKSGNKQSVSEQTAKDINVMSNSNTTLHSVNVSKHKKTNSNKYDNELHNLLNIVYNPESKYDGAKYDVILMKDVPLSLFKTDFEFYSSSPNYEKEFLVGEHNGKLLAKRLRLRNEDKEIIYNRMNRGKIDKRQLASFVTCDSKNIFEQKFVEKYTDGVLHISIDVSSSMSGPKLGNAITMVTSIAKAADIIKNLDIIISLRGTMSTDNKNWMSHGTPLIAIIYDSRKDKYSKLKAVMPHLMASGTTPEGLCFAALQEEILSSTKKLKSYFCNLSDGEPYYNNYSGEMAAQHTKSEVEKMRKRGIKILSYYITQKNIRSYDISFIEEKRLFNVMYGKDSRYIPENSIVEIANSLNNLFISDK